jgi:DNA-binding transcriptional LysR family regulator
VVPRFLAKYPEITLEISADNRLRNIVAERYDAGIRPGSRLERDMIAVRVSDDLAVIHVAAPAYLAAKGTPETPEDLLNHNCVRFRMPGGALLPWRFRGKQERLEAHFSGTLIVDDLILGVRAAIDGVGVLQTLPQYVARDIAEGSLVTVLNDWAPPAVEGFYLYYSTRRQMRPALKALVDFLKESYRKNSGPLPSMDGFPYSVQSLPPCPDTPLTPVLS